MIGVIFMAVLEVWAEVWISSVNPVFTHSIFHDSSHSVWFMCLDALLMISSRNIWPHHQYDTPRHCQHYPHTKKCHSLNLNKDQRPVKTILHTFNYIRVWHVCACLLFRTLNIYLPIVIIMMNWSLIRFKQNIITYIHDICSVVTTIHIWICQLWLSEHTKNQCFKQETCLCSKYDAC